RLEAYSPRWLHASRARRYRRNRAHAPSLKLGFVRCRKAAATLAPSEELTLPSSRCTGTGPFLPSSCAWSVPGPDPESWREFAAVRDGCSHAWSKPCRTMDRGEQSPRVCTGDVRHQIGQQFAWPGMVLLDGMCRLPGHFERIQHLVHGEIRRTARFFQ